MKRDIFFNIFMMVILIFSILVGDCFSDSRKPMYMNFQKLVLLETPEGEYNLAIIAMDDRFRMENFNLFNMHIVLEMKNGIKKQINNDDLRIINLGHMYNKKITNNEIFFRFNLLIDSSIEPKEFVKLQTSIVYFFESIPPVFEAQVIYFSSTIVLKTEFTRDRDKIINTIKRSLHLKGPAMLYDAIEEGIRELKAIGNEIPLRFSIVLTKCIDESSRKYPNRAQLSKNIQKECRNNQIPLFIIGLASQSPCSDLLSEITSYGLFQKIETIPNTQNAFEKVSKIVNDIYIIRIPAVEHIENVKNIYLVKITRGGNYETIQDIVVH